MAKNKSTDFHDYVMKDVFSGVPGVTSRAMFGGWGIYKDRKIFAIITDGKLYFKVGDSNKLDYERAGSEPFRYKMSGGKLYEMSYWELPADVLEDCDLLPHWIEKSLAVPGKPNKKKKKR